MPSDAKKREQQRKKEAAKARQAGKRPQKTEEQNDKANVTNGTNQNGSTELSVEGMSYPLFSFF